MPPKSIARVSAEQFKKNLNAGTDTTDAVLIKDFAPLIEKDIDGPGSRTVQFAISTGAIDRDGDTIDPTGWDLKSFEQCGAILWGHDASQPPVAEHVAVWLEGGKLKARCRFPTKEVYAFSDTIYQLIQANVLRCTSVGFRPKVWEETDRKDNWGYPALNFKEQELMEYSIVSVPANPEAVIEAKSLGIDMGPYLQWAEKTLDTLHDSGLLVPRNAVEKAYFAAKGNATTAVSVAKRGRVLSALNMSRLQTAVDAITEVMVEAADEPVDDDTAGKSAGTPPPPIGEPPGEPTPVQTKADEAPAVDDDGAWFSMSEVAGLFNAPKRADEVTLDAIGSLISEAVDDAMSRARGR